jgi:AraC-like DNA-binding protein
VFVDFATRASKERIYQDATRIIRSELAGPVSGQDLARRVATSERHLRRVFAEVGGMGFRDHLARARMARAARLLTATSLPVAEIAHRVGYAEPGQFAGAFRRVYGVAPKRFRDGVVRTGQVPRGPARRGYRAATPTTTGGRR